MHVQSLSDTPTADDLLATAAACRAALAPHVSRDWSVPAGDLSWSCRQTLDHQANALLFYATHLATRASARRTPVRNYDPDRTVAELLDVVESAAAILAELVRAAPPDARGFHPAGQADASGFVAMACTELIIHTADCAAGLGVPFRPPDAVTWRVLARLFPWAPRDGDAWAVLQWAAGRAALPDRPRLGADWYWHCAPLAEWDGTRRVRTTPPAWR